MGLLNLLNLKVLNHLLFTSLTPKKGLRIVGAILTHYHVDHSGGIPPAPYDKFGVRVDGISKLLRKLSSINAYIHPLDIDEVVVSYFETII